MSIEGNWSRRISRRKLLGMGGMGAAALVLGGSSFLPARERRAGRPLVTHGVQSGDVSSRNAVVWARADHPARMVVEISPTESFRELRRYQGPRATARTDFTAQMDLEGLAPGDEVFYRVSSEDEDRAGRLGEPVAGSFRTASRGDQDIRFVWSGDTAGQGWGINPDFGGMRIYETMRRQSPDFFVHSGDNIYADDPIEEKVILPDGTVWRNIVTEEKSKVAQTLADFRGNYKYNLLDENLLRFNAEVPVFSQWDDHETTNNWYPGETLTDPLYTVRDVDVLSARSLRAFHEYMPIRQTPQEDGRIYRKIPYGPSLDIFFLDMRTYRGPNTANLQPEQSEATDILGERQLAWLKRGLKASRATWKVIASDMPIGLVVPDDSAFEAIANANDGAALGRELEIAELLSFIRREGVKNTVWTTADVHYTAAHRYDPNGATFQDFDSFWEFVSGPLNAGTAFEPNDLDATFGPRVEYQKFAETPDQPPSDGLQFFGQVDIAGDTEAMTVALKDLEGNTLYSVDLDPEGR